MRLRRLTVLSVAAVSALLLAGCAGGAQPNGSGTPEATPSDSVCTFGVTSGDESDAVEVAGVGVDAEVTVPDGFEPTELQRTVIEEGDGEDLAVGDLVNGAFEFVDVATGESLSGSEAVSATGDGLSPILLDAQTYSVFAAALECEPVGSTVVLTIPGTMFGDGGASVAVVVSSTEKLPTQATGADQEPVEGMPTVELAEDGTPTVTLPGGDAPTDLEMTDLKLGDGPTVEPGDTVFVQYAGVKWSDGSVFDSSWGRGAPSAFATTGVVDGFRQALEGKTVGSQVLVVIPPALGYGEGEINDTDLKGETLVFVVDILGTERVPAA